MARNQKLTKVIQGRTIGSTANKDGVLTIGFTDGSTMTVRTGPDAPNSATTGGTVQAVRQQDTTLSLDMADGHTFSIPLAEATSSVLLRAKDGTLEYAD